MDKILSILLKCIERDGLLKTAMMLGHRNTTTLSRWIYNHDIPHNHLTGVEAILIVNGHKL